MDDKPKRKRDHEPAWWQFPRPFSYRIESDYETVIQVLEDLERDEPGYKFNIVLYDNHKGHESAFELSYRVHGKDGDWNVQARITGHVWEQDQAVILEGILMTASEERNVLFALFVVFNGLFILGSWAIDMPLLGLMAATVMNIMGISIGKSNRSDLFNHLSNGLHAAKIPISVLSTPASLADSEPSSPAQDQENQSHKSKSAL